MQDANSKTIHQHVLRTLRALEPELHAAGVRHVSLFGSVARGEDNTGSDIDLALDIELGAVPDGFEFIAHIERLKLRLTAALRRDVDILVLPARRRELQEALSRESIS